MSSITEMTMECKKNVRIDFTGGELSSDGGLLLLKAFAEKIGLTKLIGEVFHTVDTAAFRIHTDSSNLMQTIFLIIGAYFVDDHADEMALDPVLLEILQKVRLASQPTLSRFMNRMDESTLAQLEKICMELLKTAYSIEMPSAIVLDMDTTLLNTYGKQEGAAYNAHYEAPGYHPILLFDSLTRDLIKAELRPGTQYCSKGTAEFLEPVLKDCREQYPEIKLYARGDSGFAAPEIYEVLEEYGCKYMIRLKDNPRLRKMLEDKDAELYERAKEDAISYAVEYGEFQYRAESWSKERRVCFKIEKPYGEMLHVYTFIVNNTDEWEPEQVIDEYCDRGEMENFIKECKNGFDFGGVSSSSMIVNANRLQVHVLAYNLFNLFRRLVLPGKMKNQEVDTIRLKLIKIAARCVHSSRRVFFKLCSSCPYQAEFRATMRNIQQLKIRAA